MSLLAYVLQENGDRVLLEGSGGGAVLLEASDAVLRIDEAVVEKIITTRLAQMQGATLIPRGRRQPAGAVGGAVKWCRLVRVNIEGMGRSVIENEPASGQLSVIVSCFASAAATKLDAYAVQACMQEAALLLSNTRLTDSPLTHIVTLDEVRTEPDADPMDDRAAQTGAVVATGLVQRVA